MNEYTLADVCVALDAVELQIKKLVELKRIEVFNCPQMSERDKEAIRNV